MLRITCSGKCQEQNTDLRSTYVALTKAFDTVSRDGLWKIMNKFGCPTRFINIVKRLHEGMMARVMDNEETSESFLVTDGVKQGSVLAPTVFSIMFSAMLNEVFSDSNHISLTPRTDESIFNIRRLQAKTKISLTTINDLLSSDDSALKTNS